MKIYHFSILFVILAITLFVITDIKTNQYIVLAKEKHYLDQSFNKAIDDAIQLFAEAEGIEGLHINRERVIQNFFLSLYSAMGISDNPSKQELIKNYIPIIAINDLDGYFIYYCAECTGSDGFTYYTKRWTEKMPYYYEDDEFIYSFTLSDILTIYDKKGLIDSSDQKVFTLNYHDISKDSLYSGYLKQKPDSFLLSEEAFYLIRKEAIISSIQKSLEYYCNKHNQIANQMGINYQFTIPVIDNSEWTRSIDHPSIIVLFQGFPMNTQNKTYNRFVIAGSEYRKRGLFYLEQKSWYYLYHKHDCKELSKDNNLIFRSEPLYSASDCVNKGAYACPSCVPAGIHPPEYKP